MRTPEGSGNRPTATPARRRTALSRMQQRFLWHPRVPWIRTMLARLHYLLFELDTAGVEILTGLISMAFAYTLALPFTNLGPQPRWAFAIVAFLGGSAKLLGCVFEWRYLRLLGVASGIFFWITLGVTFYIRTTGSTVWLGLIFMGAAQLWAMLRLATEVSWTKRRAPAD